MHELSIAQAIVGIAERNARGAARVTAVHVKVGALRQVVPSALSFAFELTAAGTIADGATLELEEVAAAGRCNRCRTTGRLIAFPLACAACGGLDITVTRGEELLVDALELEHTHEDTTETEHEQLTRS